MVPMTEVELAEAEALADVVKRLVAELRASRVIYTVEKQPMIAGDTGPASITGIWETVEAFTNEASAQAFVERLRKAYGERVPIVRVAKRTVKP